MNSIHLKVSSPIYNFETELTERLTIVIGDSGIGKTTLYTALVSDMNSYKIECDLRVVGLVDNSFDLVLDNASNVLVIVDDQLFTSSKYFASAYSTNKTVWFLVIARDIDYDNFNIYSSDYKICFDALSYRVMKIDEYDVTNHYLDYIYSDSIENIDDTIFDADYTNTVVLTEDSGSGLTMLSRLFNCDVRPFSITTNDKVTYGRDIVYDCLLNLNLGDYSFIILFIDMAAFGRYINDVVRYLEISTGDICGCKFLIPYNYRCFEYMLLCSNLFRDVDFNYDKSKWFSFEKYCENLLEIKTVNTAFIYKHGSKLRECWYIDCGFSDECSLQRFNKCKDKIFNHKFISLFKDTKFEYLLYIMLFLSEGS